jgi:hypothetical protein
MCLLVWVWRLLLSLSVTVSNLCSMHCLGVNKLGKKLSVNRREVFATAEANRKVRTVARRKARAVKLQGVTVFTVAR